MSADQLLLAFIASLAALALVLRAVAKLLEATAGRTSTDTAKDALLISLAARADEQGKTLQAVLLAQVAGRDREIAAAIREGQKDVKITQLTAALELQNAEVIALLKEQGAALRPIAAGVALVNQQLTEAQKKLSEASTDTQAQTDAAHAANVQKDYNATQGNAPVVMPSQVTAPVITDGLEVVIAGTLSIDTPPDDKPPKVSQFPVPSGETDLGKAV